MTPSPDDGPVTMSGTVDIDGQVEGSVSMIGLIDLSLLEAGISSGHQSGAYMYIFRQTSTQWRIGVTDGNQGGEIVQTFVTIPAADLPADGVLNATLTIDGTADGMACAVGPPAASSPAGCVTLQLSGGNVNVTLSDSYGDVLGTGSASPEFLNGAIPGWDDFPGAGVVYDLTVSPTVVQNPQTIEDCQNDSWEQYGFENQGLCIRFINTGKDSR